jgi:hypothetical protein
MQLYDATDSAVRPLMSAYWSREGWRTPPVMPVGDDFERAVRAGVMFRESRSMSHGEWVAAARDAARDLQPSDVGAAFLSSLTTRRLDLRSALGSLAVGRHLPEHGYQPDDSHHCRICGLPSTSVADLNVLNFERFKWGGVRRDDVTYIAFDLELFHRAPRLPLDEDDVELGHRLLDSVAASPPADTAAKVVTSLTFIKGNKAERDALLEILSVAGVLETPEHRGYRTAFVSFSDRESTSAHFEDRHYPLPWWRARNGVNHEAVGEWFPDL